MHFRSLTWCGVLSLVATACGSSATPTATPTAASTSTCQGPVGAYLLTSEQIAGDCIKGPRQSKVQVWGRQEPGCVVVDTRSEPLPGDVCRFEQTQTCTSQFGRLTVAVSLDVPKDARELRGSAVVDGSQSPLKCTATYRVSLSKGGTAL